MTLTKEERRIFYNNKSWRNKREEIKRRDNYECQRCKAQGKVNIDYYEKNKNDRKKIKLVVHHKKELEHYPKLALEDDNLETLCVECHNEIHGRNFKNWYQPKKKKWDDEFW